MLVPPDARDAAYGDFLRLQSRVGGFEDACFHVDVRRAAEGDSTRKKFIGRLKGDADHTVRYGTVILSYFETERRVENFCKVRT